MQPAALPFSYLRTDSPAGIHGGSPRPPQHAPHTGFIRTPEYIQQTLKLAPPNDREDVLRRNVHRELETRMGLVGGDHRVQRLAMNDGGGGANRLEGDGRKRKRVDDDRSPGKSRPQPEPGGVNTLMRDLADYDHPRVRVKVHGLPPPVVGQSAADSHVFYTGTSLTPHNQPLDADSGCNSDFSEALLLPQSSKDKRGNKTRAKKTSAQKILKEYPQGLSMEYSNQFSNEYPQGHSKEYPQGLSKEYPQRFSKDSRPDLVLRPVSVEHPGIFDNFVLKGRPDIKREHDSEIKTSHQLPVRYSRDRKQSADQHYSSGDYLEPSPRVAKPSNGNHENDKNNGHRKNNGNHRNGIDHTKNNGNHRNGIDHTKNNGNHKNGFDHTKNNGNHRNGIDHTKNNGNHSNGIHHTNKRASDETVVTSGVRTDIPVFVSVPFRGSNASVISGSPSGFNGSQDPIMTTRRGKSQTTCCCHGNAVTLAIILVLMLLIGFAAGFIAGWFGRQ